MVFDNMAREERSIPVKTAWLVLSISVFLASFASAAPIIVEAEDYVSSHNEGGEPITVTSCGGASGGYAVEGYDSTGDWIELRVTLAVAGTYEDILRSAGELWEWSQHRLMVRVEGGWRMDYGYRAGGGIEKLLVHVSDIERAPAWFRRLEIPVEAQVVPRQRPAGQPPAPRQIAAHDIESAPTPAPPKPNVVHALETERPKHGGNGELDLQTLPGITNEIAAQMTARGWNTVQEISLAGEEGLQSLRGVGSVKAERIMSAIHEMQDERSGHSATVEDAVAREMEMLGFKAVN